jgi:hypothetical protein
MSLAQKAVDNHKHFYSCSAAVLCAFAQQAGLSVQEAKSEAAPFAGGRMGKCGAVLAAEYVLRRMYPEQADEKAAELEERFRRMNQSVMCRELKGGLTGSVLRPCRGCVSDAAELLEEMI